MTGYVIRDYFGVFRPGRLGKGRGADFLIFPVYYFGLMIFTQWKVPDFGWTDAAVQAALFLPMVFVWCSVAAHPLRLARMMYLCPMDREERRRYLRASYGFRVCFHMLVCVLGLLVVVPFSYCDLYSVLLILGNDFSISILGSGGGGAADTARGSGCNVRGQFLFAAALVSNLIQYGIVADEAPDMGVKLVLALIFAAVQVPLGIRCLRDARGELEAAAGCGGFRDRRVCG